MNQPVPIVGTDPTSDDPVVIERVRVRSDSGVTRTVQVVRQGDKVLSITKPRNRSSGSNWVHEKELER